MSCQQKLRSLRVMTMELVSIVWQESKFLAPAHQLRTNTRSDTTIGLATRIGEN